MKSKLLVALFSFFVGALLVTGCSPQVVVPEEPTNIGVQEPAPLADSTQQGELKPQMQYEFAGTGVIFTGVGLLKA